MLLEVANALIAHVGKLALRARPRTEKAEVVLLDMAEVIDEERTYSNNPNAVEFEVRVVIVPFDEPDVLEVLYVVGVTSVRTISTAWATTVKVSPPARRGSRARARLTVGEKVESLASTGPE
jgi:hypothetical protein